MGLCKTLNCLAQKAKSPGGILVVRALYRTVLTDEICSQYNQEKKKKKEKRKKKEIIGPHWNRLLMITF